MKKLKMITNQKLTFEEGCNKYLEYCRQRNLRQDTIRHYHQSFIYFYKYLDKNMPNKTNSHVMLEIAKMMCLFVFCIFLGKLYNKKLKIIVKIKRTYRLEKPFISKSYCVKQI